MNEAATIDPFEISSAPETRRLELEKLRAEIWKIAATTEDETGLVQNLLDKAGPIMGCQNIAFMPYDENQQEIVVKQQWREDGQSAGLGDIVPRWIFKRYLGQPYIQLSFDKLPGWLQPILNIFQGKYGTRSSLVVAYGDPARPDGYIAVNNYTCAREYTPTEIDLFIELSKIIHLRSEQLRDQAAVRTSEARLALTLEGANLGTWDWNVKTGELILNEHWAEMLEYRLSELEPHVSSWQRLLHPEDEPRVMAVVEAYLAGKATFYQTEHRLRTKTGGWKWVLASGKVLERDGQGQAVRLTGTHQDITDRLEAEAALRASEELLDAMFSQAMDGIFFMMLDEPVQWDETVDKEAALDYVFSNQRITRINAAMLAQYQATEAEFIGLTPGDFFAHAPTTGRAVWRQFFDEGRLHIETDERRFDGSQMWIEGDYICLYDEAGRITGHFGIQRDVTDRRQAEAALQESHDELEATLAELQETHEKLIQQERLAAAGQLAAGNAHHFNNILTGILGYAELLQMDPQTPVTMRADLAKITTQSQRAAQLVSQLLDFSRKSRSQPRPVNLALFMQEFVHFLEEERQLDNIRLDFRMEAGEYQIAADPVRLHEVMTNLVINARDAMPGGGVLSITLDQVQTDGRHECIACGQTLTGEYARLTVRDTGHGIEPEEMPHIFEPFYTTKEVGQGTGLGLAQVHGIVHQHSGHLTVESEVGQGTTIAVYLTLTR